MHCLWWNSASTEVIQQTVWLLSLRLRLQRLLQRCCHRWHSARMARAACRAGPWTRYSLNATLVSSSAHTHTNTSPIAAKRTAIKPDLGRKGTTRGEKYLKSGYLCCPWCAQVAVMAIPSALCVGVLTADAASCACRCRLTFPGAGQHILNYRTRSYTNMTYDAPTGALLRRRLSRKTKFNRSRPYSLMMPDIVRHQQNSPMM